MNSRNIHIAILGAGFAGLAMAWHLLNKHPRYKVTVIDEKGIGKGASGISAGLLHPYTGMRAKKNLYGDEGFNSSLELLKIASKALGELTYQQNGHLRLPIDDKQEQIFKKCAEENNDTEWLSIKECQFAAPGIIKKPGLFLKRAISVFPEKYLYGLWLACQSLGAHFETYKIHNLTQLDHFQIIIAALGNGIKEIPELKTIPVRQLKGQILQIPWPEDILPLKISISSEVYLVMDAENKFCYAGSTFEREFTSLEPNLDYTSAQILPSLTQLFPAFKNIKPSACKAGIRMTSANYMPLIKKIDERCHVYTGLGTKGLLYHSFLAQNHVNDFF